MQETFISRRAAKEEFYSAIDIPLTGDDADYIRDEYSGILRKQHEQGNNGLVRTKFFTFAIEADSLKMAKSRLTEPFQSAVYFNAFPGNGSTVQDGNTYRHMDRPGNWRNPF